VTQILRLLNSSAEVSDDQASHIATAIETYLQRDVCPAWGLDAPTVALGPAGQAATDWVLTLSDETDPGVLGYHDDAGVPNSIIFVGEILGFGGGVLQPSGDNPAVSAVVAHEAAEMTVDPLATLWAPRWDGTSVALEVADPVQGFSYDIGAVSVSDFVLPTWFLAITGKVDQLGLGTPAAVSSGGYMIVKAADGATSNVEGDAISGIWLARAKRQKRRALSSPPRP
jgi:hypothetical protein